MSERTRLKMTRAIFWSSIWCTATRVTTARRIENNAFRCVAQTVSTCTLSFKLRLTYSSKLSLKMRIAMASKQETKGEAIMETPVE